MILLKKITLFFVVLYSIIACGPEDIAGNLLTGGLYGVAKVASSASDPCKLGLSSCNNGNGIAHIKEVNTTIYIDPKDLNTTPSLVASKTDYTLNVGDKINVFLQVSDQDLDEVTVTALTEKPSVATVEVFESPDRLLITALAGGSTFAKAYGEDDDKHIGESQSINITVLGAGGSNASAKNHSITFTKEKVVMKTSDFLRIGYTAKGLQEDYTVEVSLPDSSTKLVDINVSKSATTVDIYSNATYGITVASFTFTDSAGATVIKDLQIEVTNGETNPPADPSLTEHTVVDPNACRDTDLWKKLKNSYSVGERAIDSLNSITFLSLSTATGDITLYYQDMAPKIQPRPDDAMDIKVDVVPRVNGESDTDKGYLIQTSKVFFGSGFYYVKIDESCYRGEFPKSDAVKNYDIYKRVKIVVK